MAKSTYVWLDQLSRVYGRDIRTLDGIPDEELDTLSRWGVTGLWLIGLWERSKASEKIKRLRGQADAVASAYSLDDYRIAGDLGGEEAYQNLRDRAWTRGIRLSSDMVPNHMGIDSRWVIDHPEWFLSLPEPPYPVYGYNGPDLSDDPRVGIVLEDHYWDDTDAAVVFKRFDRETGDERYVYHGNDGTSFPWNDTAQLDFLDPAVREQVIQTILAVARQFPIIRFDAAMVLAKKHIQRLWWPEPGSAGAIPSRAEHAIPKAEFDRLMPHEFWREVVDRVAQEVPGTLLLAEAFWLLEGYFVRTLGMHRVYNSAFMHMLRDEDGAGYRKVIKETIEFDPEILKRYVNFMSNPDEKPALQQFGKGDKYFGVATVLATLPGLPMLGHGQVQGFGEQYGMEFRRAMLDEKPDPWLVERHEREIFPLLHRRAWFAEASDFLLYDLVTPSRGRRRGGARVLERLRPPAFAGHLSHAVRLDQRHDPDVRQVRGQGRRWVQAGGPPLTGAGPRLAERSRRLHGLPRRADRSRIPPLVEGALGARPRGLAGRLRDQRLLGVPRHLGRRLRAVGAARRPARRRGRPVTRRCAARAPAGADPRAVPGDLRRRPDGRGPRRGGDLGAAGRAGAAGRRVPLGGRRGDRGRWRPGGDREADPGEGAAGLRRHGGLGRGRRFRGRGCPAEPPDPAAEPDDEDGPNGATGSDDAIARRCSRGSR